MANLQIDNEFLIKNAADELQKITEFIELYQKKQNVDKSYRVSSNLEVSELKLL